MMLKRAGSLVTAALLCALGNARAQLDDDQPTCAPLNYVLKVIPGSDSQMQLSASVNGTGTLKVDSTKDTSTVKANVTARIKPAGNVLNIEWKVLGDANRPSVRTAWVSLQLGSGSSYTPVAVFRTDYYPGRQALKFNFDAPPPHSLRCEAQAPQYAVVLGQAVGEGRVTQWTLSVNGKFYAITNNDPSNIGRGLRLDLRPYLVQGKNNVKVQWTVLKEQNAQAAYGAQIVRTVKGQSKVLAQTVVRAAQGQTGQLQTVIEVP
ncbi:hypothetical protein DKM44_11380 [Deinococcus irradiatisoli]|uniref:Uncharacterized protein n=1 Tax=Deinococcus irradiatisoli TaxID=2202254 RepID=A0A2Z3JFK6_9DEIO|nr:hypothetical protein [Deinococcus irradiatisoli]AWN23755.1 hypothetical protein DKM44_11380 [Deinococcus irradiatisoli]